MNADEHAMLLAVGWISTVKLSKTDTKLWLAFARLATGDPMVIENETNRALIADGRMEYSEAALAREARASRNTIADNRERLEPILTGLSELEAKRTAAVKAASAQEREERRTMVQKDRIIEQQVSVIAAQQVQLHALRRRLAADARRAVSPDDPSPPLGHRRRPARASGPPGRVATPGSR